MPFAFNKDFDKPSECAVTFFFMLSGFIMCMSHEKHIGDGSTHIPGFMFSRLAKIYPLHLLGFVGAIILSLTIAFGVPLTFPGVAANIFLIQSWFPDRLIYYSCNGVSWFLSTLLFCYLMFIPIARFTFKHTRFVRWSILPLIVLYLIFASVIPASWTEFAIYIFPPVRLVDFYIGMWLYTMLTLCRKRGNLSNTTKTLAQTGSIILVILSMITTQYIPHRYTIAAYWWLPLALLIFVYVRSPENVTAAQTRSLGRGVSYLVIDYIKKGLVWFGDISFSFFMLHSLVSAATAKVIDKLTVSISVELQLLIIFLLATLISYISQTLIVTPLSRYLRSR
ncbi:MAG: acyltransferase [Muribaculaceae bacterium]|nr:acyltransferase [Muribaculaceae bacterium]